MDRLISLAAVMLTIVFISTSGRAAAKVCWDKTWYNNSNPINGSEFETLSPQDLAKICPNGAVIDAQCADDKFEGFSGNKTDPVNHYIATCSLNNGLVCHPFKNTHYVCPDMAIQYGCECPTTSGVGTAVPPSTGSPSSIAGLTPAPGMPTNVSASTGSPISIAGLTPAPGMPTKVSASTGSPADPNQRQKLNDNGRNNGIKNERHNTCLLSVLILLSVYCLY